MPLNQEESGAKYLNGLGEVKTWRNRWKLALPAKCRKYLRKVY